MTDITLTYFDYDGGRGEDARLALHVAGVEFNDNRISKTWGELKPKTPYGSLPTLEVAGKGVIGQSNAILTWIGRTHDLHPSDPWEAARHEGLMAYVEQLRERIGPVLKVKEPDKESARQEFADGPMQQWGANVEAQLDSDGPFAGGDRVQVVDLKLFNFMSWFVKGGVDHVPTDVFRAFPKMNRLFEAVRTHPAVRDWYQRRTGQS